MPDNRGRRGIELVDCHGNDRVVAAEVGFKDHVRIQSSMQPATDQRKARNREIDSDQARASGREHCAAAKGKSAERVYGTRDWSSFAGPDESSKVDVAAR